MLDCACRFEGVRGLSGLRGLADASSEFETLNNAIVGASMRGGAWLKLATDWQNQVVENRTWLIAIPPVWSNYMEKFWTSYGKLYRAEPNRTGLANPYDIAPTGISGALRDLFAPTIDTSKNVKAAVDAKIQAAENAAAARVQAALRAAGKSAAEGAKPALDSSVGDYMLWGAGLIALAFAGRQYMKRHGYAF